MNYFFMRRLKGLKSKITLANFPCVDEGFQQVVEQLVYVAWSDNFTWQVRVISIIPSGQVKTFFESDLLRILVIFENRKSTFQNLKISQNKKKLNLLKIENRKLLKSSINRFQKI